MSGLERHSTSLLLTRDTASRVLSLLQSSDEIAIDLLDLEAIDTAALPGVLSRAYRRHQAAGLFTRFPFGSQQSDRMLGPGQHIPSDGAVLLAFHAGAGLDVTTLAESFNVSPEDAGNALYRARIATIDPENAACAHMRSALGRYADTSLEHDVVLSLVNHSRACDACGEILSEFRALDERIDDSVRRAPAVPIQDDRERSLLIENPLLLWVPIGLLIVAAIATLALLGFGSATQSGAAPLFATTDADEHPGWLLLSTEQEVMAFDLQGGERRRILEGPAHDWWNPWIVSPNAQFVVRWEEFSRSQQRTGALRAYDMQGERRHLHRWTGQRSRTFSGWLDDRTVLFAERGPISREGVASAVPQEMAPSVIAADLETGDEWTVYQGFADKAVPSPDGRYLAVVRPAPAPWPAKTVDLVEIGDLGESEVVASLEHRHLSWPGRMVWARDSSRIYFSVVPEVDVPDSLPSTGDPAPSPYEFEQLAIAALGIDGVLEEFTTSAGEQWLVPQTIDPGGESLAVAVNESMDRDAGWKHGTLDLQQDELSITSRSIPGSRWWNSESLWLPHIRGYLTQQLDPERFGDNEDDVIGPMSLLLETDDASPMMVFQDSVTLRLRRDAGFGLLRWVPDEVMQDEHHEQTDRPVASEPSALSQATSNQQLMSDSSIASTGRYVLLRQHDPDAGTRDRLMHLQAWGGTQSDSANTREFSWLPREPAVIGATEPQDSDEAGSRLVFVGTDQVSPLHGFEIDPAGLGDAQDRSYRLPVFSQNGANLAFLVENHAEDSVELWVDLWGREAVEVTSWTNEPDRRLDPALNLNWISDDSVVFTRVTEWNDGFPQKIQLVRAHFGDDGDAEITVIREYTARGSDRGIDLVDLEVGAEEERIAIRLRNYTGSDPDNDVRDSILVSPVADLSQSIEIVRADAGDGMTWIKGDRWLVAGIDGRIAMVEATGREIEYLTSGPAAFPVLIGPAEIWYQDLSDDGRIMRMTFD
jgi:hypothetical protein